MLRLLGAFNSCRFVISQLHKRIINLLYNLRNTERSNILSRQFLLFNLFLDPEVGLLQTFLNSNLGFPSELFHDKLVIGVATTDTHWSINVLNGQLLIFERESDISEFNHIDHLCRPKIDWNVTIGKHETKDTFYTIINESERTGLLSITPHLKVFSGGDCFAAESSRGLFSSSLPSTAWSVDVVEASSTNLDVEITTIRKGHFFGV
mmetsp:Transcript_12535/g.18413  ORF Transcript_12535/g.18413 Transcript_12535/m.18413 type:complete len:207 (+) Transcript_12535:51-671(+)